jgi:hypothetical protein
VFRPHARRNHCKMYMGWSKTWNNGQIREWSVKSYIFLPFHFKFCWTADVKCCLFVCLLFAYLSRIVCFHGIDLFSVYMLFNDSLSVCWTMFLHHCVSNYPALLICILIKIHYYSWADIVTSKYINIYITFNETFRHCLCYCTIYNPNVNYISSESK